MKFNFEKTKKIAKNTAIIGLSSAVSSLGPKDNVSNVTKDNISKSNEINVENAVGSSVVKDGIYFDFNNKYFKKTENHNHPEEHIMSDQDKKIYNGIKKLEEKFKSLSKSKGEIIPKSFSIIGSSEILGADGAVEPEFNDVYISDQILTSILDSMNDVRVLGRDLSSFSAMDEEKKLHDEGYIEHKGDYKYFIPEYYFIIDPIYSNDSVVFNLKLFSVKERVIQPIDSEKYLFNGNSIQEKEKNVNEIIVPSLISSMKNKIRELGLNND